MYFFWLWIVLRNVTVLCHYHSWLKRSSNQLTYTTEMIRGDTQTDNGSIACLVTFCLAPNSWSLTWSRHFLSVIITTFLENVCAFSLSIWFDCLAGQTEWETMPILFIGTTRKHCISWLPWWSPTENVATKWLAMSWLHKMSQSMW